MSTQYVPIDIQRQELELFDVKSKLEVLDFLNDNEVLKTEFFYANEYPALDVLADRIYNVINDPYIDTLYKEAVESYDLNSTVFKEELETGISNLSTYYPDRPVPRFQTLVTGLYNDLYIDNRNVIIGIDYFIGEDATYKPVDIPQYILRRYNYKHLPPTILKFMTRDLAIAGRENTLLSEMIDFGKIYYFISLLLPCTPDHLVIGFTEEEIKEVKANQEIVWASLIENEALYETSEFTKQKFLGERPNVYEIGEKCPGRIGAWVGWEIVKSYAAETGISVQDILSDDNHHEMFSRSKYKPKNQP